MSEEALHIYQPLSASAPVKATPLDKTGPLKDAIGLCLSGGGYRAMVFHLGALLRLNEAGYLGKLDRISSVSGGSITAGVLALHWKELGVTPDAPAPRFSIVMDEVRKLAGTTVDVGAILKGTLLLGTVSAKVRAAYDRVLFHGATLQDLPDSPRFVINATSVQSGVLFRFSKPYLADYRVGTVKNPRMPLAAAVAASSAFPPVLSPAVIDFRKYGCVFEPGSGIDLHCEPYTRKAVLTDGGVYDNLGLETIWKRYQTVLVSDGGGHMKPERSPWHNWPFHAYRVLNMIDNQVRSLRVRQLVEAFQRGERKGVYWGIRTNAADYGVASLSCPHEETMRIAGIATRLKALSEAQQECLINWGYAAADAALRKHVIPGLPVPDRFPFSRGCRF
ncbi:MAG: patatin-like phospholipase family protein [Bryobacteraceae bacterium]